MFSTLSYVVFVMSVIAWHRQAHSHLELKTRPRVCPVYLCLSVRGVNHEEKSLTILNPELQEDRLNLHLEFERKIWI
jgi:hypothetical protein